MLFKRILITTLILSIILNIWQFLEWVLYGHITPDTVDSIIFILMTPFIYTSVKSFTTKEKQPTKAIFLDIDGVLNHQNSPFLNLSEHGISGLGVDDDKLHRLSTIISATNAIVVLSSSWKVYFDNDLNSKHIDGKYLLKRLEEYNICLYDKTNDTGGNRGEGIRTWLNLHPYITKWIVLDDEIFDDFAQHNITSHLIQTDFYNDNGGLTDSLAMQSIFQLNHKEG